MPHAPSRLRRSVVTVLSAALAATPLALLAAPPAQAGVDTAITTFPFLQTWSNGALISTANDWSGVTGTIGYRGDDLTTATGADPQSLTGDGSSTPVNVAPNSAVTSTTGGVLEIDGNTIAMQGSGTADAPHVVFRFDLTGKSSATFSYDAVDLDASADNTNQQIAVQYRVGATGSYVNLPDGYIADASDGPSLTKTTHRDVVLPAVVNGEANVFVRVMTTNAPSNDELIGIDNVGLTVNSAPAPLAATDPGDKTAYEGRPLAGFPLQATGGTPPFQWTATGLPAGVTVATDGAVSGTPTETGTFTIDATVTDSLGATASTQFDLVVSELPDEPRYTIPEIQGTSDTSPLVGEDVSVEGVVTARYPDGGINGYVIQTPGYDPQNDATPDASDGLFVYFGSTAGYPIPAIGDHVTVLSGRVSEFSGITEITVTNGDFVETRPATAGEAVTPGTLIPGTDCVEGACPDTATLDALREAHEHEAYLPAGPHTVTDSYSGGVGSSAMRGEFKLAIGSADPLYIPLEKAEPTETARLAEITAYNNAHGVVLDDGSTVSFNASTAYPWLTLSNTVRAGAGATFVKPVVLDYRFGTWRLQPSNRIQPGSDGSTQVAFEQDRPAAPDDVYGVDGNLKIATFNMLNYFVHPAQNWDDLPDDAVGTGRTCTYYNDRAGNRITANTCTWRDLRNNPLSTLPDIGPRGAATEASLLRQEVKEVAAINTMDADVMSLEEVENPVKIGYADRDAALERLVAALNADYDAKHPGEDPAIFGDRWAFVPSPRPQAQPTITEQDAIRSAFIYNPRVVATVGRSEILVNSAPFRNAREPLAQAFRHIDGTRDDAFLVIVNHFKSKSAPDDPTTIAGTDNEDTGNGAGSYNGDRVRQARALNAFASSLVEDKGIPAVFMTGDYNSYSSEDPVTTLEGLGWHPVEADNGETSYFFGGLAGSLDHVFANDAAQAMLQGATIWPINANEPVYYEYSRYNYNVTPLYDQTAFRSSDHNPEIIGIEAPISAAPADVDTVQVLASNDFHGRLLDDPASASAGAAAMAGAVKSLRAENDNTTFVMAGDIVGASTFESFIQNDKPTIDAMNEAGLEVSAAGNHEFDQGYDDLMDRIMSATAPEGGANWPYIAANVRDAGTGDYALKSDRTDGNFAHSNGATWWKSFDALDGGAGIRVGFVGAVTEDLDSLVAPSALDGLAITGIVDEVNAAAADLKADGCGGQPCDLVIELVHEGAPSPSCDTIETDQDSAFGRIVHDTSADVDAIISGHTHLKYNCKVPVAGKTLARPVVSAGQYGSYLNQLQFDFTPGTDDLVGIRQHVLAMKDYDEDAATAAIVDDAVDVAETEGAVELGQVDGPFKRARRVDPLTGVVENRGGESTLGNLVAEIQRWKTGADIGVMNPGGLRDDLIGTGDGAGPVTYREAANVQPFANTLMTTELTGVQLKLLLEQQWQRDPDGNIPSRPFLRLGTSAGFTFTEDASRPEGDRITGMWLDGVPISPTSTYTVSANSFMMSGGDNFRALTLGTSTQDTGFTDLQATVDYLGDDGPYAGSAVPVDFAQHGVGIDGDDTPTTYLPGDEVTFSLDSWSMTGEGDAVDSEVLVSLGGEPLGSFPVSTALPTTPYDLAGQASVTVTLPDDIATSTVELVLTGATTGTTSRVELSMGGLSTSVTATAQEITYGEAGEVVATVTPLDALGTVEVRDGTTLLGWAPVANGSATVTLPAGSLAVGMHTLDVTFVPADDTWAGSSTTVDVTVVKAAATVTSTGASVQTGETADVAVTVTADGFVPTGTVEAWIDGVLVDSETLSGSGTATLTVGPFDTPGDRTVEVRYSGDAQTLPASGSATVSVTQPPKQSTTTTVSAARITYGYAGTATIRVSPATATGTVTLRDARGQVGTAELVGGEAEIVIPAKRLKPGSHTLVASYSGSATHEASQGSTRVTVVKQKPTMTVQKPSDPKAGKKATFVVTVDTVGYQASGQVTLKAKGQSLLRGRLRDGQVTFEVRLAQGKQEVTVKYLGDDVTAALTQKVTVKVDKK